MTDEQKHLAITLSELHYEGHLSENEYCDLLELVITKYKVDNIPWINPSPWTDGSPFKITYEANTKTE